MQRLFSSVVAVMISVIFAGVMLSQLGGWELRHLSESVTGGLAVLLGADQS